MNCFFVCFLNCFFGCCLFSLWLFFSETGNSYSVWNFQSIKVTEKNTGYSRLPTPLYTRTSAWIRWKYYIDMPLFYCVKKPYIRGVVGDRGMTKFIVTVWNECGVSSLLKWLLRKRQRVCGHTQFPDIFKATFVHQNGDKTALWWSRSAMSLWLSGVKLAIPCNLFVITLWITVINWQKSAAVCRKKFTLTN